MKSHVIKKFASTILCSAAIGTMTPSTSAQEFPFPLDFDPTDIPLMVMERMGVDFEAEGINVEEMRDFFRERIAERLADGDFPGGFPFPAIGDSANQKYNKATPSSALDQLRGPNPEKAKSEMLESFRKKLEISNDDEWEIIKKRIEAVLKAKRAASAGDMETMSMMMPSFIRKRLMGGRPTDNSSERSDLQEAISSDAEPAELKRASKAYVDARIQKQKSLEQARTSLREILTVRQEAIATLTGLL